MATKRTFISCSHTMRMDSLSVSSSSPRKTVWTLLFVLSLLAPVSVHANFGDYVDPTFQCPANTTCPQVCVASMDACPSDLKCPADEELCVDGSCAATCDSSNLQKNPCEYECAPVACARIVITYYDSCLEQFKPQYDAADECQRQTEEATAPNEFREGAVAFFYAWVSVVTIAIGIWCAYNQRWSYVPESMQLLSDDDTTTGEWQTGYKTSLIATTIHVFTILTLCGFQIILAGCSISYYVHQDKDQILTSQVFDNEKQALQAFEITWILGFLWSYALKWPYSIQSLFLRRCLLGNATHVAIFVPFQATSSHANSTDARYIVMLKLWMQRFAFFGNRVMAFLFSDVSRAQASGKIQYCVVKTDLDDGTRFFVFNFRRYNYDEQSCKFVPGLWETVRKISDLDELRPGLSRQEVRTRRALVGPNVIEMLEPNLFRTFSNEFSKPFYTYQNYMVWTWVPLWYFYMALVHGSVILAGGVTVALFRHRNDENLYKLTQISGEVYALRDGLYETIPQTELVPGDIVVVTPGITYCDMVLVSSAGVLVDESALTGESNPVAKTAVDRMDGDKEYSSTLHKRHTISAGTTVLESERQSNLAVVTKTGSFTSKGELLRSIFAYQRHQFKFDVEVGLVIVILFIYSIFGFAMVVYLIQDSPTYAWFYGMYVVATVLPPLLPTVFTTSVGISDNRLARKQIVCTNSEGILVAGKVKRAFFDKTGTLTKQGLDFISVSSRLTWPSQSTTDLSHDMALGMAVCHSLISFESGEFVGNPVDREMFLASGASFVDTRGDLVVVRDCNGNTVEVVKQFDFDHHRMTQSVIVKTSDGRLKAFAKGSGESIKSVCRAGSLPNDFNTVLRESAKAGIYQISMASKDIPAGTDLNKIARDDVESDLTFAGVINFKNAIREETPNVILQLEAGEVKPVMITGDNMLTGICIAKESGMIKPNQSVILGSEFDSAGAVVWIDESEAEVPFPSIDRLRTSGIELAVTGKVWATLLANDPKNAVALAEHIRVYGRCTPFDKVSVVSTFVDLGYITLMCGDGGNDCGALKTAHVGIALSDAEASIVSPFTSLDKSITSVVEVLKEGRCALASALASYKFIIMYGQIEALTQIINAYFKITFSEWCWIFMDGIWTISMAFTLPLAQAERTLARTRPTSSLLGPHTMCSTLGVLGLNFSFTAIALAALLNQDWFECRKWDGSDVSDVLTIGDNYESEVVFLVTGCQYIFTAMAFNFGYEWRQAWHRNYVLAVLALVFIAMQFYITLVPGRLSCFWRVNCENDNIVLSVIKGERVPIQNPFNTTVMPVEFRWSLIFIMIANGILVVAWDFFAVNKTRQNFAKSRRDKKLQPVLTSVSGSEPTMVV